MKSLKNRILSGAMAGVLALSLAIPAMAADNQTVISGTYKKADIAVTVTRTAEAFINPYGLDLEAGGATIKGQQIVSAPVTISNESAMNLQVGATVTGAVPDASTVRFSAESAKESTTKSVYAFVEAKAAVATDPDDIPDEFGAWEASATAGENAVIVSDRGASTDNLVIVKAAATPAVAPSTPGGSDGTAATYKAGSIAMVRLGGDCPVSPRDAWAETDTFTVTIAYTFTPVELTKYTITKPATFTVASSRNQPASVTVDASAAEGDTVTITVVQDHKNDVVTFTATDAEGNPVTVSAGVKDTNDTTEKTYTYTFTMPASAVTLTGNVA